MPAKDSGDGTQGASLDVERQGRPVNTLYDRGADEYGGATSTTTTTTTTAGPTTTTTAGPTTTTVTTSTVPGTTTTTLAPFTSCLDRTGPVLTLPADPARMYYYDNRTVAADTTIDARAVTWLAESGLYPMVVDGGTGICITGPTVLGQYDCTVTREAIRLLNHAGVAMWPAGGYILEHLRFDNILDGIRPLGIGGAALNRPFEIKDVYLTGIRDDCVEDDILYGGTITDSLFDGCYTGISARPRPSVTRDGSAATITLTNVLMRLKPMPGPEAGTDPGHGGFFRWDNRAPKLAIHNSIFYVQQLPALGKSGLAMPAGKLAGCSNNTLVWAGAGAFPGDPLPACFTVTTDTSVWTNAVAAWKAEPEHAALAAVPAECSN